MRLSWAQILPSVVFGIAVGAFGASQMKPADHAKRGGEGIFTSAKHSSGAQKSSGSDTDVAIDYDRLAATCLRAASSGATPGRTIGSAQLTGPDEAKQLQRLESVINAAQQRGVWTHRDSFIAEVTLRRLSPEHAAEMTEKLRSLAESGVTVDGDTVIPTKIN